MEADGEIVLDVYRVDGTGVILDIGAMICEGGKVMGADKVDSGLFQGIYVEGSSDVGSVVAF